MLDDGGPPDVGHDEHARRRSQARWVTPPLIHCDAGLLAREVAAIFRASGVSARAADVTAGLLVRSDARGYETHGVSRVLSYVERLLDGSVTAQPRLGHEEVSGVLHVHGDGGLGQVVVSYAMDVAAELVVTRGALVCLIHDTGHLGALGVLLASAAERGLLTVLAQASAPVMAPEGAHGSAVGNNPIAFGCPLPDRPPVIFDMACSTTARGKIISAKREGELIPIGWAVDRMGRPTTDPGEGLLGMLLPAAGHKGLGLAIMIQFLAALLGGEGASGHPLEEGRARGATGHHAAFLLVINPALVAGKEAFDIATVEWVDRFLATGARLPGQRAALSEIERRSAGIPLSAAVVRDLQEASRLVGMTLNLDSYCAETHT